MFGETGSTDFGIASPVVHELGQKSGSLDFEALVPSHMILDLYFFV